MVALGPFARHYFGIDILPQNLAEAGRQAGAAGLTCFRPVHLAGDPAAVAGAVDAPLDVFISTAVFQHFPSKDYGAQVLRVLSGLARVGAIGSIQIRYDNGNPRYAPIGSLADYADRHITATSWAIDEFADLCAGCGLDVLYVNEIRTANNYATFALRKVR